MARLPSLARALASVVNILDPDVIVLGGGLSNIQSLYGELPPLVETALSAPKAPTRILRKPPWQFQWGSRSGLAGAEIAAK